MTVPNINVLIVEDDSQAAEHLQSDLNNLNYNVSGTATNALDAIDLLNQVKVDIAIINPELGGRKNGIWVGKMINKKYRVPFIFLTDSDNRARISEAMTTNPNGFVMKPFSRVNISAAIQLALQNSYAYTAR